MSGVFSKPEILKLLYTLNGIWHFMAFYYFTKKPHGLIKKHFKNYEKLNTKSDDVRASLNVARYILNALGLMNTALVITALIGLNYVNNNDKEISNDENKLKMFLKINCILLCILGTANMSQFIFDVFMHKNNKVNNSFYIITIPDMLFGFIDYLFSLKLYLYCP